MTPAKVLTWVSLVAALGLTAQAEWELALAVGWWIWVAWLAPVSLDSYVIAAFRAGRDRTYALGLMSGAVFASHAVPVAFPKGLPWWITGTCSVLPPIVAWRIHELWRSANPTVVATVVTQDASAVPVPKAAEAQNPAPALSPPADDAAPERARDAVEASRRPAKSTKRATRHSGRQSAKEREVADLADELAGGATYTVPQLQLKKRWSEGTARRRLKAAEELAAELADRHNDEREAMA